VCLIKNNNTLKSNNHFRHTIFVNFTDMAAKRKPESQIPSEESDQLLIRPLYVYGRKSIL